MNNILFVIILWIICGVIGANLTWKRNGYTKQSISWIDLIALLFFFLCGTLGLITIGLILFSEESGIGKKLNNTIFKK
jgi:ABC-type Mn2+/Zn2+ transport system permease subunit